MTIIALIIQKFVAKPIWDLPNQNNTVYINHGETKTKNVYVPQLYCVSQPDFKPPPTAEIDQTSQIFKNMCILNEILVGGFNPSEK